MARTLQSQLILSLIDRVTAPARGVQAQMDRLNSRMAANDEALRRARGGVVDAIGAYYSLRTAIGAPIAAAAEFETILEDIGQKADVPVSQLEALGDRIKAVARDTNQANKDIAGAVDALAGRGASLDVAMVAAGPIGKAATAYRASADDLAAASWAAVDNLKVPSEQIGKSLDVMAVAGKMGAFELRDMAQYFPSLGAAYQGLGQTGVASVADLAAALQVVRKGTGDSSTAATNLANVIQKIYSPATVRAFKKEGVDVFAEMEAAARRGLTPIEAIAELTNETLDGDLSKMGNLFEDSQVQAGMRSLIQNMDEYRRIRAEAGSAEGIVDADFARRIKTTAGLTKRWTTLVDNLNESLGAALVPSLHLVLDALTPMLEQVTALIEAYPEAVARGMMMVGSLIALRGALAAVRFVGLLGKGGALSLLAMGMNTVGRAGFAMSGAVRESIRLQAALAAMDGAKIGLFGRLGAGLRGLAGVTGLTAVRTAIAGIAAVIGGISAPVWLGIAAAVAALGAAWKYWDRISAIVSGVATAIGERLAPEMARVREWAEPILPILQRFADAWTPISQGIDDAANAARNLLGGLFSREILTDAEVAQISARAEEMTRNIIDRLTRMAEWVMGLGDRLHEAGANMIKRMFDGMKAAWDDSWLGEMTQKLSAFGRASDTLPAGAGIPGRQVPMPVIGQAKAVGGYMQSRIPTLVGERGPEVIYPSRAGWVAHATQAKRLADLSRRARPSALPSRPAPSQGSRPVNVTFGNIVIQGGANASARDISREIGRTVQAELRGTFTDPY